MTGTARSKMTSAQRTAANRRCTETKIKRNRALIAAAKEGPCVDCGIDWLPRSCMHLDHEFGPRSFQLTGRQALHKTRKQIEAELAKCQLRCPNCHAIRHHVEEVNGHH